MWRLVRVDHVRCGETDGCEYFLVPPEWTEDEIQAKVDKIATEMIEDAKVVLNAPENPGSGPKFSDWPDLTVKQIKADFVEKRDAYELWKKQNNHLTRSFDKRMREVGFLRLWEADDNDDTGSVRVSAYYGHNHGLSLNYKMWGQID